MAGVEPSKESSTQASHPTGSSVPVLGPPGDEDRADIPVGLFLA